MIEVSHRFEPVLVKLYRFGSRVIHPAISTRARRTSISVSNDAEILHILATIRRNLIGVQRHCAFADAFS